MAKLLKTNFYDKKASKRKEARRKRKEEQRQETLYYWSDFRRDMIRYQTCLRSEKIDPKTHSELLDELCLTLDRKMNEIVKSEIRSLSLSGPW